MIARSVGRTDRTRAAHRAAPVVFGAVLLAYSRGLEPFAYLSKGLAERPD